MIRETHISGRKLVINKLYGGAPLRLTKEESEGVDIVKGSKPRKEGDELDTSYINFYITNGSIVLPGFGDEKDELALETLSRVFPDRKVVNVPGAREISLGGGNIHCITQQQPIRG